VAIGASAGGFAPLLAILAAFGNAPGVAVVVVHTHQPARDEALVELLAQACKLPITVARPGIELEPDQVYLLASDAELALANRRFETVEPRATGAKRPVDRAFESLALDPSVLPLGVVLSGSGRDGSAGARAIVASGGVVMAEDECAEVHQLPRQVAATGCVDFVLAPAELANQVVTLVRRWPALEEHDARVRRDQAEIVREVELSTGAPWAYETSAFRRSLVRRMAVRGVTDAKSYAALLRSDPGEAEHLQEDVLVCVPSFFRDPALIDTLKHGLFPRLLVQRPPKTPLRIWAPGTATGEDVYGLVIAIHEYAAERGEPVPELKIFGTDLSERAIARARSGRFPDGIAGDVSPERLQTYFRREPEGYRIRDDIRAACVFSRHDLTRDPMLSQMDLVCCRNVLDCLPERLRMGIVAGFQRALRAGGFLLLGHGETPFGFGGFGAVDEANGLFERLALEQPRFGFGLLVAGKPHVEELDGARRYAETLVDTISHGVVVLEPGLRVRSANRAFLNLFGRTAQEVEGWPLDALGVEVLCQPGLLAALRLLGPGESFADYRVRQEFSGSDPEQRSFAARARRLEHTELTLLIIEDVTAAEEARAAVRRAELDFRRILHEADEAIVLADSAGQPFFANRAAAELFGYGPDEMLACSLGRLLPELDLERDEAGRARASSGEAHRNLVGRRKDGTEFPARVVVTATARDRRPVTVVFVTDVTQEHDLERARREFQERLERMAFDAALTEERERRRIALELHDRLGQSLALAQLKLASAREEVPGELKSAVNSAVVMVDQAVSEVRTLMFELSPPVLYELGLRDAISWLAEDVERRYGLHVEVVDDGAPKRLDDVGSGVVFRAVRELLINVVKHAGTPHAKVTLSSQEERFVVEVLDEGTGFVPTDRALANGGGFGLFSVRQQVSRLAGLLEVESGPGRGTRAVIRVPLPAPP
jgi:PAS domain S-box-containing protein